VRGIVYAGIYSMFFFGALVLQHTLGFTPLQTGVAFLPMTLTVALSNLVLTPRLLARFGPKLTLLPGLAFITAGLLVLTQTGQGTAYAAGPLIAFLLFGIGAGLTFVPLLTIAMADIPVADAGLAYGIVNVSMQVSAAIGLAAMGSIAADRTGALAASGDGPAEALLGGYHLVFELAAILVAAAFLLAVTLLRSPRPAAPAPATEAVPA
jgi:MFS family permease